VNTKIQETFTQTAEAKIPENAEQWAADKRQWRKTLREKVFRGWPTADPASHGGLDVKEVFSGESSGLRLSALDFTSQRPSIRLRLYLAHPASLDRSRCEYVVLHILDEDGWKGFLAAIQSAFAGAVAGETPLVGDQPALDRLATKLKESRSAAAFIAPRGVGPTAWNPDERKQTQIRRRFMLLGQTRDGMQVWDAARAAVALRSLSDMVDTPLRLSGRGPMAGIALYASLCTPEVARVELQEPPKSHREAPIFLNVLRFLDMPQAVAMAAERSIVRIDQDDESGWEYPEQVARKLGWEKDRLQIRTTGGMGLE
jgi:hypothetical protein